MRESTVEDYLVKRVKAVGGEIRKARWVGRSNAPDRVLMLPFTVTFYKPNGVMMSTPTVWVEVKSPETIKTFPANAHERAQQREHNRMRDMGQMVAVIGTREQVDALLW